MEFQKSVIDIIKARTSCRSFDAKAIDKPTLQKLNEYIEQTNAQMNIKARFLVVAKADHAKKSTEKLGTYGMISGASSFIAGVANKGEDNALEFGYWFEKVVLFATDLGLGTCWLGGTFNRSDFSQKANLRDNEFMPIVSPVGFKKERPRVFDTLVRAAAGSNNRKPWSELFFQENSSVALKENDPYRNPLEMVRLAPSASNKQPWRVIADKNGYHFYICRTKGYPSASFDVQKNDVGIAKCHFELCAIEMGYSGSWEVMQSVSGPDGWDYVATWSTKS